MILEKEEKEGKRKWSVYTLFVLVICKGLQHFFFLNIEKEKKKKDKTYDEGKVVTLSNNFFSIPSHPSQWKKGELMKKLLVRKQT